MSSILYKAADLSQLSVLEMGVYSVTHFPIEEHTEHSHFRWWRTKARERSLAFPKF